MVCAEFVHKNAQVGTTWRGAEPGRRIKYQFLDQARGLVTDDLKEVGLNIKGDDV